MNKFLLFLLSIIVVQLISCSSSETETIEENTETTVEEIPKSINLYNGARLHIAHVGEDLGNKIFFYKESCGFTPYAIDIVTSEQGAQMWDLEIHSDILSKRYLLENFKDVEGGLSLNLMDGSDEVKAELKFTSTDNVYSFNMDGLDETLYVFFDEDVNAFDIMGCSEIKPLMKNLADRWIPVTETNGEWQVFEECRYGTGHVYIDEHFIEYSGGGDAQSYDISEATKEYGNVILWYKDYNGENIEMMIEGADGLIAKFIKNDKSSYYVASENIDKVKVVKEEPCDE